jgi:hypothetical protein
MKQIRYRDSEEHEPQIDLTRQDGDQLQTAQSQQTAETARKQNERIA